MYSKDSRANRVPPVKRFGFCSLSREQEQLLADTVKGKRVVDIGGGGGELAKQMLAYGAKSVVIVDDAEAPSLQPSLTHHKLDFDSQAAHKIYANADVLVMSWPINNNCVNALPFKLPTGKPFVYIGANHGGTACGTDDFWGALMWNEVSAFASHPANNFIVYQLGKERTHAILWEERNGRSLDSGEEPQPYRPGVFGPLPPQTKRRPTGPQEEPVDIPF